MKYRYLTLDCYGTLVDWRAGIEASLLAAVGDLRIRGQALLDAYVRAEKKQESSYKKYWEVLRSTVLSMSGQLGVDVTEQAARRFASSVPTWPAYADTSKFLKEMGRKGYERYILSNVDTDLLRNTISNQGLEVDGFVTAEEVGSYKPNPGHWLRFMEKTGARKDEVLHVAQSVYHDIIPTNEMGIDSAWVNRYNEPMPQGPHPLFVSDSLAHLAESLDKDLP
ncbi:MAG TPA: haloacid dehalogenase type II [Nitrososphaerales archaeon]|nr:haloacid dehalogenase type II [Nitrososphaerales archaeon]